MVMKMSMVYGKEKFQRNTYSIITRKDKKESQLFSSALCNALVFCCTIYCNMFALNSSSSSIPHFCIQLAASVNCHPLRNCHNRSHWFECVPYLRQTHIKLNGVLNERFKNNLKFIPWKFTLVIFGQFVHSAFCIWESNVSFNLFMWAIDFRCVISCVRLAAA